MNLRTKLIIYLVVIHLVFAVTTYFIFIENRLWIFVIEAFFVLSLVVGSGIIRSLFKPLELILTGSELIKEKDFTSKFREISQPEMDRLVDIFNSMIDELRSERLKLEEQHFFLHKILEANPSGIITFDFDEKITLANPRAGNFLQLPAEELTGKTLADLHSPFTDALLELKLGESKVIPLQGSRRMKCQKSQFLDRGFRKYFIVIEELTEEIRQSEKAAYEKLIRMMSHEVNNSVGAVNSLLHSCLNYSGQVSEKDRDDYINALSVAITRTGRLNEFMQSFSNVVRLPQPNLRSGDIIEVIKNISALLRADSKKKGIVWDWDIQDKIPPVKMDKTQIEQAFLNIFKNSIEAIENGGRITVRCAGKKDKFHITVEDTGCGISEEVRKNLFAPFYSTKENGQGIGLTLVQEILNRHKFKFSLDGSPNGPTQFTISIDVNSD